MERNKSIKFFSMAMASDKQSGRPMLPPPGPTLPSPALLLFFLFFPFATDAKSAVRMNCSCSRSVTLSRPEAAAERQPNRRDGVDQSVKRIYKRTDRPRQWHQQQMSVNVFKEKEALSAKTTQIGRKVFKEPVNYIKQMDAL
jgi:hypothetical protein